jgi:hypothetical protein
LAVEFNAPDGSLVLRYGDLQAVDAAGQALPIELSLLSGDTPGGAILRLGLPSLTQPVTLTAWLTSPLGSGDAVESLPATHDWTYKGATAYDVLGASVSTAGDVNGDGYDDIIVGAWGFDSEGKNQRGKVFVWYGSSDGLGTFYRDPDWSKVGEAAVDYFGYSTGTAGDVNGDGYSDIVVGVRYYNNGQDWEGAVYVFYGGKSGMQAVYWRYESNQVSTDLGFSVGTAGDVNGDGYADILAGVPYYESGQQDEGAVLIYYCSNTGMGDTQRNPDWKYESDQASALFGYSVDTAGDVNGDGYADILAGVPYYESGQQDEGAVLI